MKVKFSRQSNTQILSLLPLAALFLISGCSTTGSSATLPLARSVLDSSREDRLSEYAPLELRIAGDKIEQAELASKAKDFEKAERLAQQAMVNLKLAEAKATAKKAERTAEEIERNITTLRNELSR